MRSWNELRALFGSEMYNVPIVVALNKYDLENGKKLDKNIFIDSIDFQKFKKLSVKETIAIKGDGVLESFKQIIGFIFPQLTLNVSANT